MFHFQDRRHGSRRDSRAVAAGDDAPALDETAIRPARDGTVGYGRYAMGALGRRVASWQEERLAVELAYRRWADAASRQRKLAYAGYLAALEREEKAARVYASEVEWARRIGAS